LNYSTVKKFVLPLLIIKKNSLTVEIANLALAALPNNIIRGVWGILLGDIKGKNTKIPLTKTIQLCSIIVNG